MSTGHAHSHLPGGGRAAGPHDPPDRAAQRRALWIALVANGLFLGVEVAGGIAFGSLVLLADAAHMASDVAGLAIALVAHTLMTRPASRRHTYGLQRAEVLGAQANAVLLLVAAVWILVEAARRIASPAGVEGWGLLAVAAAGLVVNVASAVPLWRAQGRSLNLQGAFVHMASDAAGSLAAVAAGLAVVVAGLDRADPIASIVVALLVVGAAGRLLRDTTHVLLEGAPRHLDIEEISRAVAGDPAVEAVHHVHVWDLASDTPALSAHVVLRDEPSLHEAQERGDALKVMLAERFGIAHATLELECHGCASPDLP